MPDPVIVVDKLSKAYIDEHGDPLVAVNRISFEVFAGECFGLLGPNGAGKTTTLRMLATLLRPSRGRATIGGHDLEFEPEAVRRSIGFISGTTGVYDRLTARETVELFGRLNGLSEDLLAERIERLFDNLGMHDLANRLALSMSTGMKQKVSIARALVHDPPVVILDEATSGLDVMAARNLQETVVRLRDEGKCVIYSTHIMREAERLCDRIAIIHEGAIRAIGTLEEFRTQHGQQDLEDLFFAMISATEAAREAN